MIDRKNSKDAVKMMHHVGEDMKRKGVSLWIFPEGTRSSRADNDLLPFKKGAFHLSVQANVPIVPVVCENYHRLFDGKTRLERGTLKVKVLPPISTEGLTTDDVPELAERVRKIMLEALKEISAPGPSDLKKDDEPQAAADATNRESERLIAEGSSKDYGSGDLRRRVSPASSNDKSKNDGTSLGKSTSQATVDREIAETGQLDGGVTAGIGKAAKKQGFEGSEEEDEGAVLVKRPSEE